MERAILNGKRLCRVSLISLGFFPSYNSMTIPKTRIGKTYRIIMILLFSYSGVESFIKFNRQALSNNMRVATVFKILPVEFEGRRVINGDDHDARFIEDKNIIVGLKAKGKARQDKTGFVIA
jgi:hypothetical protein